MSVISGTITRRLKVRWLWVRSKKEKSIPFSLLLFKQPPLYISFHYPSFLNSDLDLISASEHREERVQKKRDISEVRLQSFPFTCFLSPTHPVFSSKNNFPLYHHRSASLLLFFLNEIALVSLILSTLPSCSRTMRQVALNKHAQWKVIKEMNELIIMKIVSWWGCVMERNLKGERERAGTGWWDGILGWNSGRFLAILVGHFKSPPSRPSKPQQGSVLYCN